MDAPRPGRIRIGISGWRYPPWRGVFYPKGLVQRSELAYAAERFGSVEINGSFYSLQRPSSYLTWAAQTPDDFVFAVKGGRFITHHRKLANVDTALANFFASGVLALGAKLGPILWQLPPGLGFHPDRLTAFFDLLPRTTADAAELAKRHDERLDRGDESRVWASTDAIRPLRHCLEVRHASFAEDKITDLLRRHDIAMVVADTAGKWPLIEQVTSDFAYLRLHGDVELYVSGYSDPALDSWADKIRRWSDRGFDVYVYFDNDVKVHAPYDALALMGKLGLSGSMSQRHTFDDA